MMLRLLSAFDEQVGRIVRRSRLFAGRRLMVDVIVNFTAGALSSERRALGSVERLARLADTLSGPERSASEVAVRFHATRYVGHARELASSLLEQTFPGVRLIASAGGDGTHREVLSAWTAGAAPPDRRDEPLFFIRLPFGTGNDGSDAPDLASGVALLAGQAEPDRAGELIVTPRGMPAQRGYNITSIGLDAYVAYLTNRVKARYSGDAYKIIADVMTLLYERVVGADPMVVDLERPDGGIEQMNGTFLILAVGVSGHRTYGGGKLVLPGEENVCAIEPLGLAGKIRLKKLFYRGEHVHEPTVTMRSACRLTVAYHRRIPMQIDGETIWLAEENFPLSIDVRPPTIPVLRYRPDSGAPE